MRRPRHRKCWVPKLANCLEALPQSLPPKAKAALHEIMNAEPKEAAVDRFGASCGAKSPKAVEKLL